MLRERPGDIREAFRAGLNKALPAALRSGDAGVRQAALALLAGLVQHPGVVNVLRQVGCATAPSAHVCVAKFWISVGGFRRSITGLHGTR